MRVSRITSGNDWTFGRGRANYAIKANAVHQKVKTRLQCFVNDWVLDTDFGIDWIELLGRKGTQSTIKSEVERMILGTVGVAKIENLDIEIDRNLRSATINATIVDIYSEKFAISLEIV